MFKRIDDKKKGVVFIFHPHNVTGFKVIDNNFQLIFKSPEDVNIIREWSNLRKSELIMLSNMAHEILLNKINDPEYYMVNTGLRIKSASTQLYIKFMNCHTRGGTVDSVDLINLDMDNITGMFFYIAGTMEKIDRFEIIHKNTNYRIECHPDGVESIMKCKIEKFIKETITLGE